MSVTEVHQGIGRWNLTLRPVTPRAVRERLNVLGHIVITPTRLDLAGLGDPASVYPGTDVYPGAGEYPQQSLLQRSARYTGVVLKVPRGRDLALSGYGLAWWLGEGQDGPILANRQHFADADTDELLSRLLPLEIRPGATYPAPTKFSGPLDAWQPVREALDYALQLMGCQWRINADGTLDAGAPADLFGAGIQALAVTKAGWDADLDSLDVASLSLAEDAEGWVSDMLVLGRGLDDTNVALGRASRPTDYQGPWGDDARRLRVLHESQTEDFNADLFAANTLVDTDVTRREVSLSVADYHIDRDVHPGSLIGVYDPGEGIFDLTNQQQWRGRIIYPLHLRMHGATWPITEGMGVYYRAAGFTQDLTDYVAFESGDTQLDVGAIPRQLTNQRRAIEALLARLRGRKAYQ